MPRCTSLLLTRLRKRVLSSLYIRFQNKVCLLTSSLFLSTQINNHWIVLSVLLTTLCPMLVPLLPKCFWVETAFLSWRVNISQVGRILLRQRIEQFSELFLLEFLAQFHDRLWNSLCPPVESKDWRWLWFCFESFHNFWLICLPLGFVFELHLRLLSISSNWIHLWKWSLWLSGRFQLLLVCSNWLEEVVHVEI